MTQPKRNRFTQYFAPLLDALRATDPTPMRPAAVRAWMRSKLAVPAEDLTRYIKKGKETGKQSIFENDVHWARFYLAKAGLIEAQRRGLWALTAEGRRTELTRDDAEALCVRIRSSNRQNLPTPTDEEDVPAPGVNDNEDEEEESFWFVGAVWHRTEDQIPRFLKEGIWQNGESLPPEPPGRGAEHDKVLVRQMKPGDRIAIKATFVRKHRLPFDAGGKSVSGMRIKATGTILENVSDGKTVKVAWDPPIQPRDWYFYTYRTTIIEADAESEKARRLVDFTFRNVPQDYNWFLAQPYWVEKYGAKPVDTDTETTADLEDEDGDGISEVEEEPLYSSADIVAEGSFLTSEELDRTLETWRSKKNLVLQGPPGTGKTWLAKRLGFALVGSNDRETTRSRLRVVQFHPSLAYEDFIRGWRPAGDNRLALVDGIFMQAIEAAASEPDLPFVLVIEEINRGNPAQIFGEMLTLLEDTKRRPSEAMELAYRKSAGERAPGVVCSRRYPAQVADFVGFRGHGCNSSRYGDRHRSRSTGWR